MRRWIIIALVLTVGILIGHLVVLYCAVVGFPTTPMTAEHAEDLFGQLRPGSSAEEVKAWLVSNGIPAYSPAAHEPCYDLCDWKENEGTRIGDLTPAECAGLRNAEVFWLIRVEYKDAQRMPFLHTRIIVYLFFGSDSRLMKTWVDKENEGL